MIRAYIYLLFALALLTQSCATQQTILVLLPDTQTYAEKHPEILDAQIDWILKEANKIDMVIQQGDLTQNNNDEEWTRVRNSFKKLDGKVPYVLAVGNHDMGSEPKKFADVRNTTLFNTYFPINHMSSLPTFAGVFEKDKMDNAYYFFRSAGVDWMVLSLEFGPRNEVLDWANELVSRHPKHLVILNTHAYMYADSTRHGPGDHWLPQGYGIGKDTGAKAVNNGEDIWLKFVKKHPNIRFVFSGHVLHSGVGTLVSMNEEGLPVYQFLANYQEGVKNSENGGNGWLRIMTLSPKQQTLDVQTYSPYLQKFRNDEAHSFKFRHVYYKPYD